MNVDSQRSTSLDIAALTVWDPAQLGLSSEQQESLPILKDWLCKAFPSYVEALEGIAFDPPKLAKTAQVETALMKALEFPRPKERLEALETLAKIIGHARRLGRVQITFPRIATSIRYPRNRFAGRNLRADLERFEKWQALIDSSIPVTSARSRNSNDSMIPLGCVLLSAVIYGGLLHTDSLVALVRALASASTLDSSGRASALSCYQNRLYVELPLSWRGAEEAEGRVWYPDPLTSFLLMRLQVGEAQSLLESGAGENSQGALSDRRVRRKIWDCVSAIFRFRPASAMIEKWDRPSSWKDLFDTVALAGAVEWPAVCVDYATRKIRSHSLKPSTLARVFGQPVTSHPRHELVTEDVLDGKVGPDKANAVINFEPSWLADIRTAFGGKKKDPRQSQRDMKELLKRYSDPTAACRMVEFACGLLKCAPGSSKSLAVSTIRSSVVTVSKRFGCLLGGDDPTALTIQDLETLYAQVLTDADPEGEQPGLRRNVARALKRFHEYLVAEHCQLPLENREVLGFGPGLLSVDANLITPEELQGALDYVSERSDLSPDLRRVLRLGLILGCNCGLRRMELLGLRVCDLCEDHPAELLIHPWEGHRLKTKSATRKMPLFALLSPQELDELLQWKADRKRWASPNNPFLFTLPATQGALSADLVIPHLHTAMRTVTHDNELHFHHLRHSFATWTLIRLLHSSGTNSTHPLLDTREHKGWLEGMETLSSRLYAQPGEMRRHVYAVALLLGHSSPQITLEHYVHGLDGALGQALARSSLFQSSSQTLLRASGLSSATFFRWSTKSVNVEAVAAKRYRQLYAEVNPVANDQSITQAKILAKPGTSSRFWIDATWNFLYFYETTPAFRATHQLDSSWYDMAEQYGFSPAVATRILARARVLQRLSGRRGKTRHRWTSLNQQGTQSDHHLWICCPRRPDRETYQQVVGRFAPTLQRSFRDNPEKVAEILDYYVHNVSSEDNSLAFSERSTAQARAYLRFLSDIGLTQPEIQLTTSQPQYWKTILKLGHRFRWKQVPSSTSALLKVEPVFEGKLFGSMGFRFLLVMAAIVGEDLVTVG